MAKPSEWKTALPCSPALRPDVPELSGPRAWPVVSSAASEHCVVGIGLEVRFRVGLEVRFRVWLNLGELLC